MQRFFYALGVFCLASFAAMTASGQAPPNDQFVNAITLSGPIVTTMGSNVGATKQGGGGGGGEPSIPPPSLGTFGGASVWWNWTAAASGQTTIDTEGSSFNTLLGVFTGTAVNRLTLVASSDDFEGNQWSKVMFNAVAGTTYRIMVDGFRSGPGFGAPATGSITLHVKGVGGLDISLVNGTVFTLGDPIPVSVNFTPDFPNPPATRVDFYRRGSPLTAPVLFASSDTAPFSAVASNAPAGSNSFYVVAFDSLGNPVESPVVNVLVQNVGITLLTPFEDTYFLDNTPVAVTAWAYLPAGSITNVEFLVDNVKFAEAGAAPYSGTWSSRAGSHRLTAIGRSDSGARYVSQPVNIGVVGTLIATGAVWKYLDNGTDQGTAWYAPGFDDSTWKSGPAELGYGDGDEATVVEDNGTPGYGANDTDRYTTTYFRRAFDVSDISGFASIVAVLERDDAAVVYLNGREVFRTANLPAAPEPILYDTLATGQAVEDTIDTFAIAATNFVAGQNVFAVEIHQQAANSSDISFNFQLLGVPTIIHNLSPGVDLTAPTNGDYFLAPSEIALTATASDDDGSVAKVEFFADGVKIGEDLTAPYSVVWTNPPVAAHVLTAVATDDQGATTTSAEVPIVVYDAVGTPVGAITYPADGATMDGPTNLLVTATANAIAGVTNVQFFNNGVPFGNDSTAPYSAVWTAPFGTNVLTVRVSDANGVTGVSPAITVVITIPPTNVIAPTLMGQAPAAGATVTNLTSITVTFSEYVQNIDAADLLINGVPATGVNASNSRSNYTFTFPQPPYGAVTVTWASGHGITDYGFPSNLLFDENGPGASWSYTLIDKTPPVISARAPAPGAVVTNLTEISVTFSEPVSGVDAGDLLVNGTPALAVTGSGVNYTFSVPTPPSSGTTTVNVAWTGTNDIFDLALEPNAFIGTATNNTWRFVYDPRVTLVASNSNWLFIKGLAEASDPMSAWRAPGFDDSSWSNAPAPFFFGDPYTNATIHGTLLSDMNSNYTSIYLRKEFYVENRGEILSLLLNHQSDDGFVAWLNGVEVLRYNVPSGANGDLPYNTNAATAANEPGNAGAAYIVATLTNAAVSRLVNGRNVLAIHAFNQSLTNSSDFGFNAQLYYFPIDPGTVPPRVVSAEPPAGDIFYLTNITFSFSEGVSGVDASDLLINGVPAASVSSVTNSIYTFHFPQPPYGPVLITWDTNHGIVDFDDPPRSFEAAAANVSYVLLNPSSPRIATRAPAPNTVLTGLTSVAVTFTEPVTGVDASDFLVSGTPASSVNTSDATTYVFGFTQPPFGAVTIRWATNHGITDFDNPPAPFDPVRFGAQWNYTLIDPVPSVTLTSPTNNTFFLPPASVTLRATASDNDGTVARVEFYESASKLGEGTNAPYSLAVSNLGLGLYTFRAVATDNSGLVRTSAPVVINVVTSLPIALIRGPYLQSGSPTGGVVRWRTDAISDGLVYYGTDLDNLTNVARETSVTNEHIVQLGGLSPDTAYYYSIGSAAYRLVGGTNDGANYWFKSSPPVGTRKPIRFWALGDAGTAAIGSPDRQRSTRDAFYNYAATNGGPTDLMLMLGDNAYNSGTDSEHQAAVFDMYPTTLRNKFLWTTLGNHETSQSTTATDFPYLHIFSLPKAGEAGGVPSGTELYYSFDYGNIHFVCLDAMTSGRTATTPMARWLIDDLEQTAQEWVVVFFHHSLYTKGTHDSDSEGDLVELRQNIIPILEAHGVDLVLMGHSHVYERSYLLDGHYGLSSTFTDSMKVDDGSGREDETGAYRKNEEGRGVIYTIAGSAGQALGGPLNHPAHFISLNELGTVVVDVNENRLDAKFLNSDGVVRDYYTLTKPSPFPAAPLHLLALSTGSNEVTLSWTDAAENEAGYALERSTDGVNFTPIVALTADTTTAIDTGLSANTTYFYRVRGTNSIGAGDYSNIASVSTVLPDSPPRAPVALVANADDGREFFRSQMVLRWQDRSTNEAAFQIERSGDGITFVPIATVAANLTSFVDHHLNSATYYYYRVRAVNALGQSAPSSIASDETHPQTQLARAGETVSFHAGSEGQPPIQYQWRYLGAPLPGQTNETLVLDDVQPADEGDYSVAIRDAHGRFTSNPAWLFVLTPPHLVLQPQDTIAIPGITTSLDAAAEGTEPLLYQWFRNGSAIPGAGAPTLNFPNIQLGDRAAYYLIVQNDFGSATSRVATLDVFILPTLAPVPELFTEVLKTVRYTNTLTDQNIPPLQLAYSLAPGAPTNAYVHPNSGVFRWTPNRTQAPSTNVITIQVADSRSPLLIQTTRFTVYVNDYIELTAGSIPLMAGETNHIALDVFSSLELLDLQCTLHYPSERLTDLWLEPMIPEAASASAQPSDANTLQLHFSVLPGQSLQGTQHLGRLHFKALPGQTSAFVPLRLSSMSSTTAGAAGVAPTLLINDGRAIVIGTKALLEARLNATNQPEVTLYGRRNTTYLIEFSTNGPSGPWRTRGGIQGSAMSNLNQTVLLPTPRPPVFYRAR
jgi:hypothetical protein